MPEKKQTTKQIFWLLSILTILPFFLMIAFFVQSSGKKGDAIHNGTIEITVSAENGIIADPTYLIPISVPRDGFYAFDLAWDCREPGFITGCTVKGTDGTPVLGFSAATIRGYTNQVELNSGSNQIEYRFMTTEEEIRDFCRNISQMSEADTEDYLAMIDFPALQRSGEWTLTLNADVYEIIPVPAIPLCLTILVGILSLVFLFLLYKKDAHEASAVSPTEISNGAGEKESDSISQNGQKLSLQRKSGIGKVGIRHSLFVMAVTVSQILSILLVRFFAPELAASLGTNFSFFLIILSVDVIGYPIAFAAYRSLPKTVPAEHKLGMKRFLLFVLMGAGLCGVGGILGTIIHNMLTLPFGGAASVGDLIFAADMPIRILAVGILAPIFEELIFRKLMIDHLYKYGEFVAILASGLTFGLFHGNFQQVFFATLLGFLWAFVYVRTGKIQYTIAMHMIINMSTSAITVFLASKFMEFGITDTSDISAMMATMEASPSCMLYTLLYGFWMIFLVLFGLAGAIIFIVFLSTGKFRLRRQENEPPKRVIFKELITDKYMWIFYLACIGLFLINYLPLLL